MAEGGVDSCENITTQVPAEHRTILVQGLTPTINEELLALYFENPGCGGGEVESISLDNFGGARVVFQRDEGFYFMCFF